MATISDRVSSAYGSSFSNSLATRTYCSHNYFQSGSSDVFQTIMMTSDFQQMWFIVHCWLLLCEVSLNWVRKCLISSVLEEPGSIQGGVSLEVCGIDKCTTVTIEVTDGNGSRSFLNQDLLLIPALNLLRILMSLPIPNIDLAGKWYKWGNNTLWNVKCHICYLE